MMTIKEKERKEMMPSVEQRRRDNNSKNRAETGPIISFAPSSTLDRIEYPPPPSNHQSPSLLIFDPTLRNERSGDIGDRGYGE
jgi:hypothetical protein